MNNEVYLTVEGILWMDFIEVDKPYTTSELQAITISPYKILEKSVADYCQEERWISELVYLALDDWGRQNHRNDIGEFWRNYGGSFSKYVASLLQKQINSGCLDFKKIVFTYDFADGEYSYKALLNYEIGELLEQFKKEIE